MKTSIFTVITTTVALAAASVAFATKGDESKAAAKVAYNEPEKFSDFRMTEYYSDSDAGVLEQELTRAIERTAGHALPPDYTLTIRFTDIDLAGDINPFHRMNLNDVRVYRGIYAPRLTFDYAVLDAEGNTVVSGSEKLIDLAYDMRVSLPNTDYTRIEADMLRDFINNLGHKIAKGKV
jgi:hypothetical protein